MFPNRGFHRALEGRVRKRVWAAFAAVLCQCGLGCGAERCLDDVLQVTYACESGPILPELQWYEETVISAEQVVFTRTGKYAETEVNQGTWTFPADAERVAALFGDLAGVDCAGIRRLEPEDAPDGGETAHYAVSYGRRGRTLTLRYNPGVTYTDGDLVIEPIASFLSDLVLPDDAAPRYVQSAP